jgi:hypothetical protein
MATRLSSGPVPPFWGYFLDKGKFIITYTGDVDDPKEGIAYAVGGQGLA